LAAAAAGASATLPGRAARGPCYTVPVLDSGVGAAGTGGIAGAPRARLADGLGPALGDLDPPPPVEHLGPGPPGTRARRAAEGAFTGGCPASCSGGGASSGSRAVFWAGAGGRGC